jgi:hypothetical protein
MEELFRGHKRVVCLILVEGRILLFQHHLWNQLTQHVDKAVVLHHSQKEGRAIP